MSQLIDPALARNMAENADLASRQREFDAMRRELNNGAPRDKREKLREACEGFEAVFIQKMWEQMRATVPETGLVHSREEKFWQGMYDQELSKKMAGAGGIGLADMMMAQLGKNLEEAGAKTLNTGLHRHEPIPVTPAPLLLNAAAVISENRPAAGDMYSGMAEIVAGGEAESEPAVEELSEFEALVDRLQAERQQPAITVTRLTTNANSIGAFNAIKPVRSGRGQANPRVIRQVAPQNVPQGLTP
ncbi:MAG: rod-binding protein [Deltaproteobacteria bacterium]|jgi:Rod binding domain-containing protein|nr:rod-binding protein [Deltaproteobacteria bacterium]